MKSFYGKRRNYRKKPVKKSRTYKRRSSVSNNIKRYVSRAIHTQIENKTAQIFVSNARLCTPAVNTGLQTLSMIPYNNIIRGNAQSDKLANEIRTRKCMFSFCLHQAPWSSDNNTAPEPQDIIMFIGKVKNAKPQKPVAADYAKLFQNGSASRGSGSTTIDHCFFTNSDYFTIYKRLKFKVGNAITDGTGGSANYQFNANNDYKLNIAKTLNLTKYCPKVVKFNDDVAEPTNDGLWLWAYTVNANGTFTAAHTPATMDYNIYYEYEDA